MLSALAASILPYTFDTTGSAAPPPAPVAQAMRDAGARFMNHSVLAHGHYAGALEQTLWHIAIGVAGGLAVFTALWASRRFLPVPAQQERDARDMLRNDVLRTGVHRSLLPLYRVLEEADGRVAASGLTPSGSASPATYFLRGAPLRITGPADRLCALVLDLADCACNARYASVAALNQALEGPASSQRRMMHPHHASQPLLALLAPADAALATDTETELALAGYAFPVNSYWCTMVPVRGEHGELELALRLVSRQRADGNGRTQDKRFFISGDGPRGKSAPWAEIHVALNV